ncbi:S49 family peptidase, partial [Sphingomonas sanguinis]
MDMTVASALWAMHPDFLAAQLRSSTIDAMLPDSVRGFASLMGGQPQQAKQVDPIRDGATMILPITGTLAPRGLNGSTYYDVIADRVREAGADAKVGAIVLAIRSPGGYVWGCAETGDAIYEVRQSKPVIAVADPYCFSAAYWLGTQGSGFYCTTSGEVGSVGVRSGHTDVSGFEDKIGMKTTLIASHDDKIAGHPYAPLDDAARAEIQASVDESNAAFAA